MRIRGHHGGRRSPITHADRDAREPVRGPGRSRALRRVGRAAGEDDRARARARRIAAVVARRRPRPGEARTGARPRSPRLRSQRPGRPPEPRERSPDHGVEVHRRGGGRRTRRARRELDGRRDLDARGSARARGGRGARPVELGLPVEARLDAPGADRHARLRPVRAAPRRRMGLASARDAPGSRASRPSWGSASSRRTRRRSRRTWCACTSINWCVTSRIPTPGRHSSRPPGRSWRSAGGGRSCGGSSGR